jgi:membrane-associated PAP2 superfamily phosphatase
MNRKGFTAALIVATVAGIVLGIYPQLDLDLAGLFFDPKTNLFTLSGSSWQQPARDAAYWLITALAAPAVFAILGKLILPYRRMLITSRAALFLLLTLAIGPGILANLILKEHWGRSRPIDVTEFGGTDRFTPWWDPRGGVPAIVRLLQGNHPALSGRWRRPRSRYRSGSRSPSAPRSFSVPPSACSAWAPAVIFSAMSCLPAC